MSNTFDNYFRSGKVGTRMTDRLEQELIAVGLSDKEAKVYLAALSLGEATAQQIAAKATVSRPTTYVIIESLAKQGLISSFDKGKKRYFAAARPEKLHERVAGFRRELEARESRIAAVVKSLESVVGGRKDSFVRVSEGERAEADVASLCRGRGEVLLIASDAETALRIAGTPVAGRSVRVLHTAPSGRERNKYAKNDGIEFRRVGAKAFPIAGTVVVRGGRIAFIAEAEARAGAAPSGLASAIIDDNSLSITLSTLFLCLWEQAAD